MGGDVGFGVCVQVGVGVIGVNVAVIVGVDVDVSVGGIDVNVLVGVNGVSVAVGTKVGVVVGVGFRGKVVTNANRNASTMPKTIKINPKIMSLCSLSGVNSIGGTLPIIARAIANAPKEIKMIVSGFVISI